MVIKTEDSSIREKSCDELSTLDRESFSAGAYAMLELLLRSARTRGYRLVCGLKEEDKLKCATSLIRDITGSNLVDERILIDMSYELAFHSKDVQDPRSLIGDILPGDIVLTGI